MIRAFSGYVNIEGWSTIGPAYLKELIFLLEKCDAVIYWIYRHGTVWVIENNGPYSISTIKKDKGQDVDKPKDQYMSTDWDKLIKNSRAKHIFYCGLDANEYDQISACDTAK